MKKQQFYNIKPYSTNLLFYKNPVMVAWWSSAFPGFGHILLGQYVKGVILFLWEMVVNQGSHLNSGLVATLMGNFSEAKNLLAPVWILLYIPIYLFTIWDSYNAAIENNKAFKYLSEQFIPFETVSMGSLGNTIFSKKRPGMALFWSLLSPGAGQFYLHRMLEAVFFMAWFVVICYYSHFFEGILYFFEGQLTLANSVFNIQWFMYLPSIFFFSAFNAYSDALESNTIYSLNQTEHLIQTYQHPKFLVDFPKPKPSA